jgi:hypothetical protein
MGAYVDISLGHNTDTDLSDTMLRGLFLGIEKVRKKDGGVLY